MAARAEAARTGCLPPAALGSRLGSGVWSYCGPCSKVREAVEVNTRHVGLRGGFPGCSQLTGLIVLFSGSPRESWGLSAAAGASAGCDCQSPGLLCVTLPPSWGLRPSLSIFLRRCARLTLSQGQRVVQGAKIPGRAGGRGLGGLGSGAVGVGDCTALAGYRPSSHQGPSPPGWAMSQEIRPCHLLRIEETPWLAAWESLTRIQ